MTSKEINQLFVQKTGRMIGRTDLLEKIKSAIADSDRRHALLFTGGGGIGKTRLLQEVGNFEQVSEKMPFRFTGLIDLYHPDYHRADRLQYEIAQRLDPSGEHFRQFFSKFAEFESRLKAQVGRAELERFGKERDQAFLNDYASLASTFRPVLTFDTIEVIQHEPDLIQDVIGLERVSTQIESWIAEVVTRLPNTVVLFAGQPNPEVERDFQASFTNNGWVFDAETVDVFSETETVDYLQVSCLYHPNLDMLDDEQIQRWIYAATGGRPIRIALLIDLLQSDQPLSDILPGRLEDDLLIDPEAVDKHLVYRLTHLQDPDGGLIPDLIYYLVYARRGLDLELLRFLCGDRWTEEELQSGLARLANFTIVKVREETKQFLLHDEIYNIYDRYFRNAPHFALVYGQIAAYYRGRLADTGLENRENLMLQGLYYELQANPYCGYFRYFARWDEEAIGGHALDFDMSLRDETVRFIKRYVEKDSQYNDPRVVDQVDLGAIYRDMAVRWVKRLWARGQYEEAVQTAKALFDSDNTMLAWGTVGDPLYQADLLTAWGEALAYSGADDSEALEKLEKAVNLIETYPSPDEEQGWRQERILGQAHNTTGYIYRMRGHYSLALKHYQRALPYFSYEDLQGELANTLNNLAYLQALLGRVNPAWQRIRQSLALREAIGRKYPIALGRNTLGLIYILQDHPIWGERESRAAYEIFKELGDLRGLGLAHNALGLALRKRGDQWKLGVYSPEEAEVFFVKANDEFLEAARIFATQVREPIRLWEAYNELGSLYCDWGWHARKAKNDPQAALELYQESIDYQNQALKIAQENELTFQQADSYDDLAQVYGDRRFLLYEMDWPEEARESRRQAEAYLSEVEEVISPEFRIRPGEGFSRAPEAGEASWLSLGKVHLWRGVWRFRDIEAGLATGEPREQALEEAMRQLIYSVAYFERYWPASFALEHTLRYISSFLLTNNATPKWANEQVRRFSDEYGIDLRVLETTIADVLGE